MSSNGRPFDVVILGVTGFTGRLVGEYFAEHVHKKHPDVKWALAGRNLEKVQAEKAALQKRWPDVNPGVLQCDNDSQASVDECVAQTKVMLTTAGPYIKRGGPVVDACVRLGTDYVDLTGEAAWVGGLIDRYHCQAEENQVHIMPMSGYDSIPSDLGTLFAVQKVRERFGEATRKVRSVCAMAGSLSGGTLATSIEMGRDYPEFSERTKDPFNMGGGTVPREEDKDVVTAEYDELAGGWTMPFMMATINTRVVRRSNAWLHYGRDFGYQEVALAPDEKTAKKTEAKEKKMAEHSKDAWKMAAAMRDAGKLPKQGEGPDAEMRAKSWFRHNLYAEAVDGRRLQVQVSGGDPGYGETAKMISESALCLLLNKDKLPRKGGVLTPAAGCGHLLIDRLVAAGIKFEFVKDLPSRSKL